MVRRAASPSKRQKRSSLREYAAKRDFRVTPEPAPGPAPRPAAQPTFMVHKHDATRLHYDLRLEIDGVLASWAVPKGPSFDPGVKRLAVQTEDHPFEYGSFEGRIPEGEYGAGDALIWDRGTYETVPPGEAAAQRAKGHVHFVLHGEKLRGRWHLVRTRGRTKNGWILFKAKDEAADPSYDVIAARPASVESGRVTTRGPERAKVLRAGHPEPGALLDRVFPPMLATLAAAPPADEHDWYVEHKYDGFRALAGLSRGRVALRSRNALDLAGRFPSVARALGKIVVGEAVIDGEIVALDKDGVSRFQLLQNARGDLVFAAFDLLWLNGEDLRRRPIEERRDLLESLLSNVPASLRLSQRLDGTIADALDDAKARGLEGIVAKRKGSVYEGTRSRSWLKLKALNAQEAVVIGFTPHRALSNQIGALLLAVKDGGALRYAGKVGTGFSTKTRVALRKELAAARRETPIGVKGAPRMRDAVWVEPRAVAQIAFGEWTSDGKMRHPRFLGLRDDTAVDEVVREKPVKPEAEKVVLSNPERVYWPRDGITKQELADYYQAVSSPMIAALRDRPLTLQHWPKGIDAPAWFQQSIGREAPPWMTLVGTPTSTKRKSARHMLVDRPETLRWLAQHAVLTLHMWSSRAHTLGQPDWVIFDLDPSPAGGVKQAVQAALVLRGLFDEMGVPAFPKTSGGRGLHVLVPLAPGHTHDDAVRFALMVGAAVTANVPDITLERAPGKRKGRLYLDCLQNGYGKTIMAPYSPRARDGAPVSAPLAWSEVTPALDPLALHLRNMPQRLAKVGDLFAPVLTRGVRLPRVAPRAERQP